MPDKTDQFEVIVYNAVRGIALSPGDKNPQELYKTLNVRAPAVLSQLRALRTQSSPSSSGSPSASSSSEDSPEIKPKKLVPTIFLHPFVRCTGLQGRTFHLAGTHAGFSSARSCILVAVH
jgi:hypothetical protein